jgi:hypothetical protein
LEDAGVDKEDNVTALCNSKREYLDQLFKKGPEV